jgi:ribonuclease T2
MRKSALYRVLKPGVALALSAVLAIALYAGPRKKKANGSFSYYMLVLSYAPDFCAQPQGVKDPRECGSGRHVGFVVHGLWPQGDDSRGPENCGSVSPVSKDVISATLKYIPTESLIQHEWKAHGSCSGQTADAYFAQLRKARDSVKIPGDLDQPTQLLQLSPAELLSKAAAANPSFPAEAFRVSCYPNADLQELRVCFNKDLSPRACGSSAGQCSAGKVALKAVR